MTAAPPSLDQLRELPALPPVSLWPQTWGWAALAGLLCVAAAGWAFVALRRHRRNRYRREALAELARLERRAQSDPGVAAGLPALLKRTALAALPARERKCVAGLAGDAWLDYLNTQAAVFPPGSAALLRELAYAPPAHWRGRDAAPLRTLFTASRQWMERHHVAA